MRYPKIKLIYTAMTLLSCILYLYVYWWKFHLFLLLFALTPKRLCYLMICFLWFSKGISVRSSLGQSILKVEAVDADSVGSVTYSIQEGNRDNAIGIDSRSGILYNAVLMNSYGGQTFDLKLRATDQGTLYHNTTALVGWYLNTTVTGTFFKWFLFILKYNMELIWRPFFCVQIFVTEPSRQVKLVLRQPAAEVRQFFEQIKK